MVYLAGEPGASDVFYVRSLDGGKTFAPAVRVNSQKGSAIAAGTIRGAQIAVGRNGAVHVAWNGSGKALPGPPVNPRTRRAGMPMLYARSNAAGTAFEAQRNLMSETTNLDGGGSIAADERGGVYVAWHANAVSGEDGEDARRVWIARSADDGATFGKERAVSDPATGVCGCCALRLVATAGGELQLLYRSATGKVHRDIYSMVSRDQAGTFESTRVQGWEIGACPMTSMSIAAGRAVLRAWETDGQVYFNSSAAGDRPKAPPAAAAGRSPGRKHPRLAVGQKGTVLLAWTEGTAWARGGSLAWQAFGADGRPTADSGTRPGIPVWSFAAVLARPDGGFTIFYSTARCALPLPRRKPARLRSRSGPLRSPAANSAPAQPPPTAEAEAADESLVAEVEPGASARNVGRLRLQAHCHPAPGEHDRPLRGPLQEPRIDERVQHVTAVVHSQAPQTHGLRNGRARDPASRGSRLARDPLLWRSSCSTHSNLRSTRASCHVRVYFS